MTLLEILLAVLLVAVLVSLAHVFLHLSLGKKIDAAVDAATLELKTLAATHHASTAGKIAALPRQIGEVVPGTPPPGTPPKIAPVAVTPQAAFDRWTQDHQYGQISAGELVWLRGLTQADRTKWAQDFGACSIAATPKPEATGESVTGYGIQGAPITRDALGQLLGYELAYGLVFET